MRAFIAIEIPKETKEELARLEQKLQKAGADVKWVPAENLHLTLKFLGDIDETQYQKACEILDQVASSHCAFQAKISAIGAFPKLSLLKVAWVGLTSGSEEAEAIFNDLEDKIEKLGIEKESRAFASHVTLGRTRSAHNRKELAKAIKEMEENFELKYSEFAVRKITLFKSNLSPKGPTYEILKEASLQTT